MTKLSKSFIQTLKITTVGFLFSFGIFRSADAATLDDVVRSINTMRADIIATMNGAIELLKKYTFELNPNQIPTLAANNAQQTALAQTNAMATSQSSTSSKETLIRSGDKETFRLSDIPAIDFFMTPPTAYSFLQNNKGVNLEAGNQSINIDSLLAPLAYNNFDFKKITNNPAFNFIQLAGNLYQPIAINLSAQEPKLEPKQIEEIQNTPDYRRYRAAIRAYVAAQSVGSSNLYQMMAERIPQADLGKKAGMQTADASLLQLQQFMATRRSQNPQWYLQMAAASPATLQRETVFLLAEIRDQLFQLQLQNERLLATMSVMQMQQNNQGAKLNLIQLEQKLDAQIKQVQGISQTPSSTEIPGAE